jgi:hypothetical protein
MRPTFDELKYFWANAYSRSAIIEAHQWLDEMESINPKSPVMSALISAVVTAYARAFTISQVTAALRIDAGRDAHLSGKVAKALMEKAPELLVEPPKIEKPDVSAEEKA